MWGKRKSRGEERHGRRGKKAEGNIWLGAARASSRLIGLLRGHTHLAHQSPGPLFPKVGLRAQGFGSAAPLMTAPVKKTIPHLVSVYKSRRVAKPDTGPD